MSLSKKYGRTYHYPFSPGTTSDDRINSNYWEALSDIAEVVHTEKLDGENTCLNQFGVFARSHAAPTRHPWAGYLKERWNSIRNDLGEIEIFGENLYAIHSIRYEVLEHHFYVFAVRELDRWLAWEEVKFYAGLLDFPVVPEIMRVQPTDRDEFEEQVLSIVTQESTFSSVDVHTKEACRMEGIVSRNLEGFSTEDFRENVFKYVRKDHVKTDEHWTRRWQRAPLKWEKLCGD
ncbi:MAG: RNA ligase family protein [Saprospiraceae bacterium]|nr:RNA ligase family protein [Saprospiraceae bacterium]